VRGWTGRRGARQGGRQQRGGRLLLVAPADDDRPIVHHEDERIGRCPGGELQGKADQAHVLARARAGELIAQAADIGQGALDAGEHLFLARGIEGRQRLHHARPACVPVDRLAVLVQLWFGQKIGGAVPQAAAHDPAQLRRRIVQRFAAHAQGAHAASRRDDQRGFASHISLKIARGLWRGDGVGRGVSRPLSPIRAGRISAPCLSMSWAGRGTPRSAGICRRRGWRGSGR
jgi:hypothetical protein